MQSQRLDSLTSLRAFAALGVFFSHMGFIQNSSSHTLSSSFKYFNLGYAGVTFFFILSGFILTFSFTKSCEAGKAKFSDFIMHRIFRIYPVHILCLLIFLVVNYYYNANYLLDIPKLINNALLLQSFSTDKADYFSFNAVSWSISVEMFFYISFCFIIFSQKRTIGLFIVVILSIVFYLNNAGALNDKVTHWFYYINPFARLPDFLIGMFLCKIYFGFKVPPSKEFLSIAEVCSLVFVGLSFYIAANGGDLEGLKWDVIFIPSMALMVFIFSFNGGVVSKIISNRVMVFLGDASFAFYLIHAIVINVLHKNINTDKPSFNEALFFIFIALFISVFIASIIYVFFERPLNQRLRRAWSFSNIHSAKRGSHEGDEVNQRT